jgi:putative MATE family efflux protein
MREDDIIYSDRNTGRVLLKFAIPAIISLLMSELYNMVDTFYAGRYVGTAAVGALTVAFPIQRLLSSIGLLIAVGASTSAARYLGEEEHEKLEATIGNAFLLTILFLTVVPLFIFLLKSSIIRHLGASDVTYKMADEYISIILLGGIFQSLTFVMCYIMNSFGNTKVTLKATTFGALSNVVVDYIFVYLLGIGIKGAAIATVLSQIVAFLYALYNYEKMRKAYNLRYKLRLSREIARPIITVGFSTFIVEISDAVVAALLNNLLSRHGGDRAIIMVGAITKVSMFLFITVIGISYAMQPIVAYNYGSNDYKKLKEAAHKAINAVIYASTALWALMMIFASNILGSFIRNQGILIETVRAFRIVISVFPVVGVYYVSIYYYQAINEPRKSFILSIYRQLLLFIPISILLISKLGIDGAWISYPITDIISGITGYIYIKKAEKNINEEIDYEEYLDKYGETESI